MAAEGIRIAPMERTDALAVARLHVEVFPSFFLSFLGERFLAQFYLAVCEHPHGMAWLAIDSGRIVGFVTGAVEPGGFLRELARRRWGRFAWAALGAVLRRPSILPRLLRALKQPGDDPGDVRRATLISIGVAAQVQGRGMGRRLLETFLAEASQRAVERVDLITDAEGNDETNAFYRRQGFALRETYVTPEGRRMNRYEIDVRGQR